MAKSERRERKEPYVLRPGMTTAQLVCGFCWLPFYLVLLSFGLQYLFRWMGISADTFLLNLCWYALNLLFVMLVYHRYYWYTLKETGFWSFLQTLILAGVFYYAVWYALDFAVRHLLPGYVNLNSLAVEDLARGHAAGMLLLTVLLAPIVEETLIRGVVFGAFHRKSRVAAYAASMLLFSFVHVWGYAGQLSALSLLVSAVEYFPASLALGWAYEKSGSLLTPVVLHMLINAVSFGLLVF